MHDHYYHHHRCHHHYYLLCLISFPEPESSKVLQQVLSSSDAVVKNDNHPVSAAVPRAFQQTEGKRVSIDTSSTSSPTSPSSSISNKPVTSVTSHRKRSRAAFSHGQVGYTTALITSNARYTTGSIC